MFPIATLALFLLSVLTGNFNVDVKNLRNCEKLEAIHRQITSEGRELTPYEQKLASVLGPWYKQNCTKA
jgi:hypothetical protein